MIEWKLRDKYTIELGPTRDSALVPITHIPNLMNTANVVYVGGTPLARKKTLWYHHEYLYIHYLKINYMIKHQILEDYLVDSILDIMQKLKYKCQKL